MDKNNNKQEIIPFSSIASKDFERDLIILKKVLHQFEQRIFQLALPPHGFPYNKKTATMKIVDMFQN